MKETTDILLQLSGYQVIAALPEDTVAHRRGKVLLQKNCTYCHEIATALRDGSISPAGKRSSWR